jgi:hypothetical protein
MKTSATLEAVYKAHLASSSFIHFLTLWGNENKLESKGKKTKKYMK